MSAQREKISQLKSMAVNLLLEISALEEESSGSDALDNSFIEEAGEVNPKALKAIKRRNKNRLKL